MLSRMFSAGTPCLVIWMTSLTVTGGVACSTPRLAHPHNRVMQINKSKEWRRLPAKPARVLIRTYMSLTSNSTCTSVRRSEAPTHYSGLAPDRAKFMPHRKSRGLTRLARQRSAYNSSNYARRTLLCDCGPNCLCPARNSVPALKVGISTLCRHSDGSPIYPGGPAKRATIILWPAAE
jgi:hypothetical protein